MAAGRRSRQPEATARRKLIDAQRHARLLKQAAPHLMAAAEEAYERADKDGFPDDRLKLLFVCAHPEIDAAVRTPLMLQTLPGLDAARIASAFLMRPSAMASG